MIKVIGVRFKSSGRIYYFDPVDFDVHVGDGVIVETARGQEFGDVVQDVTEVEDTVIVSPLKPVLRLASERDKSMREQNTGKEDDAFVLCQKKIEQHGLDMKLVDVDYSFNGSKVVFYFTADERVDFRELVKDLAGHFKTRIELRQIGVRDEAKMLGGLGSCGRPVCCKTFLDDFRPVSIKMAKEQNLSLSPTKISGLCGRLMCCLQYEQSSYEEMKKKMPRVNREVSTPDGIGYALENNAITEKTRVRVTLQDGSIDVREYHYSLLGTPGEPLSETVQQARREMLAGQEPAPVAEPVARPAVESGAQGQGEPKPNGNNRRRRRGGNGNRPQEASDAQQQAERAPKPPAARQGTKRQPAQQGNRAQQPTQQGNRAQQPAQQGNRQQQPKQVQETPGDTQPKPNPNRRRRRRGGAKHASGTPNVSNQGGASDAGE